MQRRLSEGMYKIYGEGALVVLSKAKQLEQEGKQILHFEIGQPDFPTPTHISESGKGAIDNGDTTYVAADGIPDLKLAIQQEIEESRGYRPSLNQILVMPGAKPGVFFSIVATCEKGDEIIFPDPGFPSYQNVSDFTGAKGVPIALREDNKFRLDPADVAEKITPKTKLIILNSPHNPTGSAMTKSDLQSIAELAEDNGIFILSDEIYSKIIYDQEFHSPTIHDHAKERSIIMDGFSKSYSMTGWRLGYLVGPEPLIERLSILSMHAFSCTAPFVQRAGVTALQSNQEELHKMVNAFRKRKEVIVKGLDGIPGFSCQMPEGAFYAWPNITGTGMTSQEVADYLLNKAGVACLPGNGFGDNGEGYLRFSYATSIEDIHEAITRIEESLNAM